MEKAASYQFRTNINCSSCVRSVTNFLNEVEGIGHWEVDTEHPEKLLTVTGGASAEAVIEALDDAGFDAQKC